ncbi:MAG TPA: hypothetical protein DCF68_00570 [Cyanothece sp. UBA12306]|nr:hypothetical protein [Cyanothece sp. UBA12306]
MYLAIYITSEAIKFGVFNLKKKVDKGRYEPDYRNQYTLEKDLKVQVQDTLRKFLTAYAGSFESSDTDQPEDDKTLLDNQIQCTVIAGGGKPKDDTLTITHVGSTIEIKKKDISATLTDKGHQGDVYLLNDFQSLAYGILFVDENGFPTSDFQPVSGSYTDLGQIKDDRINRIPDYKEDRKLDLKKSLVIGPDAGLGIAAVPYGVEWEGLPYVEASEGGHCTFSPEWVDAVNLVQYIQKIQSNEDFLSHRGIQEIYNYFLYLEENAPNFERNYKDIISMAFSGNNNPAVNTVRFICEGMGALCGNMSNIFKCNDSIFLWSETLTEIKLSFLSHHFNKRFSARPKHGEDIAKIPVFLITNRDFPLYGCIYYGQSQTKKKDSSKTTETQDDQQNTTNTVSSPETGQSEGQTNQGST